jgi:hypothetical protein
MDIMVEMELRHRAIRFLSATEWAESRKLVEKHPMLLSDDGLACVERLAVEQMQALPYLGWALIGQCTFLRRCRQVGVVRAYDEMLRKESAVRAFMSASSWEERRELVEKYPMILDEDIMIRVEAWVQEGSQLQPDSAPFLGRQLRFLRGCRQVGTTRAYKEALREEKSGHKEG